MISRKSLELVYEGLDFFKKGMLNFVYPPCCLHCHGDVVEAEALFCDSCLALLQLIEPQERCSACFNVKSSVKHGICRLCIQKKHFHFDGLASTFDYVGPAATLMRKMKYGNQAYLTEGMAAFMVTQFLRLNWPIPDLLIPVPIVLTHWMQRGYNQSFLLAQEMGKLLNRPVQEPLLRRAGDYSQAGLSKEQRMQLNNNRFELKLNQNLQDKSLLLVDDVMTTGSTIRHCGRLLLNQNPSRVYAMTFCKAVE